MTKQTKLDARARRAAILAAALKLAPRIGYAHLTREDIASEAQMSPGLVSYHFGTMVDLRRAIMRESIRVECLAVIAQGVVARDRHALKAPPDLVDRALASVRRG